MLQNFDQIKEQMMRLGNASHDLRNWFAMSKKPDIPELLAIDGITGQIENQARLFISHITNPIDPAKWAVGMGMLNAFNRANNFFLRNLRVDVRTLGYEILPQDTLQKVINTIELQNKIITFVENQMKSAASSVFPFANNFFMNGGGNSNINQRNNAQSDYLNSDTYKRLDFTSSLNLSECNADPCLNNLIYAAQQTCNKAHCIQNIICYYQPNQSIAQQANQINQIAGNVEDSFRSILATLGQDRNNQAAIKQKIAQQVQLIQPQIQQLIQVTQSIGYSQNADVIKIQTLSDSILLSAFLFSDVTQLPSIKVT